MLDRYIKINEAKIVCGQNSGGVWYCKELPAEDVGELNRLIGEINLILNHYNKKSISSPVSSSKKKMVTKSISDAPMELEDSLLNEAKEKHYDSKHKS
jgi:hypothetical protein